MVRLSLTLLYTGNGATGSRALTGLSFTPGFSWFKVGGASYHRRIFVRRSAWRWGN